MILEKHNTRKKKKKTKNTNEDVGRTKYKYSVVHSEYNKRDCVYIIHTFKDRRHWGAIARHA